MRLLLLKSVYEREEAADKLAFDLFPGKHEISGRTSFDWLYRVLTGQ